MEVYFVINTDKILDFIEGAFRKKEYAEMLKNELNRSIESHEVLKYEFTEK